MHWVYGVVSLPIVQHVQSVCFRRIERLNIVSGTNVDLHIRRSKLISSFKNLYDDLYLASFGRKFITDLITLIASTRPKFDRYQRVYATTTTAASRTAKKQQVQTGKTTTLHVHNAFLYISLPSLHDYNVKLPNFTFCRGREQKTTTFFFFS